MKDNYIKINTGDDRIEVWGYLIKKKGRRDILSLYIRVLSLVHTIPLRNDTKIICETGSFQVNDIKVKL